MDWQEFMQHGKHEHKNELVFLLDEFLQQDGINLEEYTQLNNMLVESVDEDDDEEEVESTEKKQPIQPRWKIKYVKES